MIQIIKRASILRIAVNRAVIGYFFGLTMLALITTGCSEEVNPFIGTDFPFTVWGFVNPKADTQAVRLFTIDETLKLVSPEPLDAVVSILDLDTQRRFVLQDSVTQLPNGDYRHTFWAMFDVDFGQTFRIEVERSDGIVTKSADVRVPSPISITLLDPNLNAISELLLPVQIDGEPPSMPRIDAIYKTAPIDIDGDRGSDIVISLSYSGEPVFRNGLWMLDIDLRRDFVPIRELYNDANIFGFICVDGLTLRIHVGNETWRSPSGVFDPNFLVEPGTLSNIENGFGFFGAGFIESVAWNPPATMLVRAGFADCSTN